MYSKDANRRISDSVKWTEKTRGGDGYGSSPPGGVQSGWLLVVTFDADILSGEEGDATVQYDPSNRKIKVYNEHPTQKLVSGKKGYAGWCGGRYRVISVLC